MLLNKNKKKVIINKFINLLMVNGKKYKAEKIFFDLLKLIKIQNKKSYVILLFKALKIISPLVIVRSIRIKGRTFQVPIPLSEYKQLNTG